MNTHNLRRSTYLVLLICAFALTGIAQGAKTHKGVVVFTRLGVAIELEEEIKKGTTPDFKANIQPQLESEPVTVQQIDDKRFLIRFAWEPHQAYRIKLQWGDSGRFEANVTAPLKPSPYRIRTVELDTLLSLLENLQRPAQPTTIALSPDGEQLAIATDAGHLAIINPLTGEKIWKTRISEGYAKHATFSHDGRRFYIGEQSADGFIYGYALPPQSPPNIGGGLRGGAKPTLLWKYRMADDIDTSTPQNPNDVYAWVQYPGPYRIAETEDGDLLVAGVHSWTKGGVPLSKSQLYRFDGTVGGRLKWKWPSDQALPMVISWFDYSRDGQTVALLSYKSGYRASRSEPARFKSGTIFVINGETGANRWEYTCEPLKPYFEEVTFWRGVGISPNGKFINLTTEDGRAFIFNAVNPKGGQIKPLWQANLTTPLEVSGIPIIATAGTIAATNEVALFVTGDTFIPYHLQKGAQQPPSAHPNGMTLFAYSWAGEKVWQWELENMPQGTRVDMAGRYAAVSVSKYGGNIEEQLHGVSVFDLTATGGGLAKYLYTYRTEGQLPYGTIDISADGRFIAAIETPVVMPDETQRGKNRVHIIQ